MQSASKRTVLAPTGLRVRIKEGPSLTTASNKCTNGWPHKPNCGSNKLQLRRSASSAWVEAGVRPRPRSSRECCTRSEERRGGKEGVNQCRSRGSANHKKRKQQN